MLNHISPLINVYHVYFDNFKVLNRTKGLNIFVLNNLLYNRASIGVTILLEQKMLKILKKEGCHAHNISPITLLKMTEMNYIDSLSSYREHIRESLLSGNFY